MKLFILIQTPPITTKITGPAHHKIHKPPAQLEHVWPTIGQWAVSKILPAKLHLLDLSRMVRLIRLAFLRPFAAIWFPWANSNSSMWYYTGGVYQPLQGECPGQTWTPNQSWGWPGHMLTFVGYNLTANPPYWIAKNSWGPNWGINGYINWYYGNGQCAMYNWAHAATAYSY